MSTYIHNFLAYRELLKELVNRDIKIKYRGSVLGILWSVLNPLGMMIIMSIVFSHVFRGNIENFPVYVNLLTSFIALLLVIVFTGTKLTWSALLIVIPIFYIFLFSLGMGLLLSALVVEFRDLIHLYGVLLTAWMYLTPIFYPVDILPVWVRTIVELNPLTNIIMILRELIMYGTLPGMMLHVKCIISCLIVLVVGVVVFHKQQDTFILKV